MNHYLYEFVPHRTDFDTTMTEAEAAVMRQHVAYWQTLADKGIVVAFGPVADPARSRGVAIVEADTIDEVVSIRDGDPVTEADLGAIQVYVMPNAIVRRHRS